jgi:hypothetical protein
MFLDRLEDAGLTVHGDNSRVAPRVQGIADSILPLLPRMGAPMHVSAHEGGLRLSWNTGRATFVIRILSDLVVTINSGRAGSQLCKHCKDGESSALAERVAKGLSHYIR